MTSYTAGSHPANTGRDYGFRDTISEEVLIGYLSRAVNHFYFESLRAEDIAQNKRFVLSTGAKFIGRASTMWVMGENDEAVIKQYAEAISDLHGSDPDVIFEACIFETVFTAVERISIPGWVFEAFGAEPEKRCFRYGAMLFEDGRFTDHWGKGAGVPDMTRTETQMWFYYRAALFIDAGFECLHTGQVHLIGAADTGFRCWTKVMNMIRAYASAHARRRLVLLNAHTHGITGDDGFLLFDFHRFPLRGAVPEEEVSHKPGETDPQRIVLRKGYSDSLFGRSLGGKTRSGLTTGMLPYLVELDNYCGHEPELVDRADAAWWGFDEISWFANQPPSYRQYWLGYAYEWVKNADGGKGSLEMPGTRTAALRSGSDLMTICQGTFYPYDRAYSPKGSDTEQVIRDIWIKDNGGAV